MKCKAILIGITLGLFSLTATAQTTPKINKTQQIQKQKIKHGVKSGALTKKEAVKLSKQQARIRKTERAAKADGVMTRKEKKHIALMQKNAKRKIAVEKNDRQRRR